MVEDKGIFDLLLVIDILSHKDLHRLGRGLLLPRLLQQDLLGRGGGPFSLCISLSYYIVRCCTLELLLVQGLIRFPVSLRCLSLPSPNVVLDFVSTLDQQAVLLVYLAGSYCCCLRRSP